MAGPPKSNLTKVSHTTLCNAQNHEDAVVLLAGKRKQPLPRTVWTNQLLPEEHDLRKAETRSMKTVEVKICAALKELAHKDYTTNKHLRFLSHQFSFNPITLSSPTSPFPTSFHTASFWHPLTSPIHNQWIALIAHFSYVQLKKILGNYTVITPILITIEITYHMAMNLYISAK